MTTTEKAQLAGVDEKVGILIGEVRGLAEAVSGIEPRLREVEQAIAADRAATKAVAKVTTEHGITKRWVIQTVVTTVGVTAGVVFGIVGLLAK